jgi:mannitol/fructose-specific phosphotransferase system IIA component (Ntr-type)
VDLLDVLTEESIALDVEADDWRDSIRQVGRVLVETGAIEPRYIDAMIRTVEQIGPYLVLAPGVAMNHARPEDGVNRVCLGLVRLRTPVNYGSAHNDPVDIVIALGAVDHEAHLKLLRDLACFLSDEENIRRVRRASTKQEVIAAFRRCAERAAGGQS